MEDKIKEFLKNLKMNESMLSMVLGMVTIVIVGVLIFNFYRQTRTPEITETAETTEEMPSETIGDVPVKEGDDGMKYPAELTENYVVQEGDHLWKIAEKNYGSGYNWVDIARANDITDPGTIYVGQELKLPNVPVIVVEGVMTADEGIKGQEVQNPIEGDTYTVSKGDNLWDISVRAYADGYQWSKIAEANNIENPDYIEVDQVLSIPR